ncbi:MAG: type III pantothenate kinase [Gammaproteobacteria bacterium]|nr:type III pantothenate kinase [Gammaproteobacteria bacterium]MBU1416355.1 type III pantothenate kinase [Gammaproteobacteria bacterium]
MKTLCIDAGNTRIKWGLRDGDVWVEQGVGLPDEVSVDRIVACNVGGVSPRLTFEALAARLQAPIEWVRAQPEQCGVKNGYEHPDQLGADRWAALIGARAMHRGDCLVVMCGTATTVDLLRADGRFEGGLILPGLDLMRDALAGGTADLPPAAGSFVDKPRNTFDAIASGAIQATVGAIERMFRQLDPACDPLCLISGGAAGGVSPRLTFPQGAGRYEVAVPSDARDGAQPHTFPHRVVDNLVLEGLATIANGG